MFENPCCQGHQDVQTRIPDPKAHSLMGRGGMYTGSHSDRCGTSTLRAVG